MTTTTIDLNRIMSMVQKLLAQADRTNYPDEATAFRARAEGLMRKYRIEEEQLIASDQVEIRPEVHTLWLGPHFDSTRKNGSAYFTEWYWIASAAAQHSGVKSWYRWGNNPDTKEYGIFAVLVGYAGDVRLAELVYTAAGIVFGERLEPKPDPKLSDKINAYRLRSAGINRDRAAQMIWGETSPARAARVGKWYKEECLARGETPALDGRGINAADYRDQFAKAFVSELEARLRRARDASDSVGGVMVLAGREERVLEAFYQEFPELRPKPKDEVAEVETAVEETKKKGRAPKPYHETAAYRREQDRLTSDTAYAARLAGRDAARSVPLDRVPSAKRLDSGE